MTNEHGLTSAEAASLQKTIGPNEIAEKHVSELEKLLHVLIAPASIMLIGASALSFFIDRIFDGWFILALLILNVGMSLWHEHKADNAIAELRSKLAVSVRVRRDGAWVKIPSREIVPSDMVECNVGELIPADLTIGSASNLEINEAVLTGESLPKEKKVGDTAYSGSVVTAGTLCGTVTKTGNNTFFGKIATAATDTKRRSSMETDILSISRFLIAASLIAALILTIVFVLRHQSLTDTLLLDLSLLIAGIPVSLPTVMTLIISLGAVAVAKKQALVRRLTALEDFANATLLLTDKTGTLTENKIRVERVNAYAPWEEDQILRLVAPPSSESGGGAIDKAIAAKAAEASSGDPLTLKETIPGDSTRKRRTELVTMGGVRYLVSLGTPPVIASLITFTDGERPRFDDEVKNAAHDGSRVMALAIKKDPADINDEKEMSLAGVIVLSDPLRADAGEALAFLRSEGVSAIMMTGDTAETAARVTEMLGMNGSVLRPAEVDVAALSKDELAKIAAFAEVMPEDKLKVVERAQKDFVVAVTGDGINDLPAVRRADVGIAVLNAVDALKAVADIVFLAPGITAIETAIVEARKIYFRLYNYSVYRISESFRLVVIVFLLGIFTGNFPLTPAELILLAFLNDIPIITLAFDRVKRADRPADLRPRERFIFGTLYGTVGVFESIILYFLLVSVAHAPLLVVQTAFFLKLTVSGHMLIYVAHTEERWWRFLPAPSVITATTLTQLFATLCALAGILVTPISPVLIVFVWLWSLVWMQVSELAKTLGTKLSQPKQASAPSLPPQSAATS
jgi:H+-transporting ATPase